MLLKYETHGTSLLEAHELVLNSKQAFTISCLISVKKLQTAQFLPNFFESTHFALLSFSGLPRPIAQHKLRNRVNNSCSARIERQQKTFIDIFSNNVVHRYTTSYKYYFRKKDRLLAYLLLYTILHKSSNLSLRHHSTLVPHSL